MSIIPQRFPFDKKTGARAGLPDMFLHCQEREMLFVVIVAVLLRGGGGIGVGLVVRVKHFHWAHGRYGGSVLVKLSIPGRLLAGLELLSDTWGTLLIS